YTLSLHDALPISRHIASVGFDETLHVWDVASGKVLQSLSGVGGGWCVCFTPNGKEAIVAGDGRDGKFGVTQREIATGKVTKDFRGHTAVVAFCDVSRDGTRLATASHDGSVRVWNM